MTWQELLDWIKSFTPEKMSEHVKVYNVDDDSIHLADTIALYGDSMLMIDPFAELMEE